MVEFTIKAGIFAKMLKYIEAKGKNVKGEDKPFITECIVSVTKKAIISNSIDENETLITKVRYLIAPAKVKKIGLIPVDIEPLLKAIKRFKSDNDVKVTFDEGLINLYRSKPKLSVTETTVPIDSVKSFIEIDDIPFKRNETGNWLAKIIATDEEGEIILENNEPKVVIHNLDTYIKLDAGQIAEVVQDGEQIERRNFPITITPKRVIVIVEDEETGKRIDRELVTEEIKTKKGISSVYSYGFGNAFGNLSGEIEIWLGHDLPMVIVKKEENLDLVYNLATVELAEEIEEEEDEAEEGEAVVDDGAIKSTLKDSLNKGENAEETVEEDY